MSGASIWRFLGRTNGFEQLKPKGNRVMTHLLSNCRLWLIVSATLLTVLSGCGGNPSGGPDESVGISAKVMADALHAVMESDRTVYATRVVHRLQDQENVIRASEHWRDEKALPLPAQMFRMGAQEAAKKTDTFSYSLLSKWPINKKNAPRTEMEIAGLDSVAKDPSKPFYGRESLGGIEYLTAVYADQAVSPACVTCHNAHQDSPRTDFELGDTMGGIVIRIRLR